VLGGASGYTHLGGCGSGYSGLDNSFWTFAAIGSKSGNVDSSAPGQYDITFSINSAFPAWHISADPITVTPVPPGMWDMMTTALHEIGTFCR
jgi:hypothetical protein